MIIFLIVVLNALLGFNQEYRAEKAMAALKALAVPTVKVRREGRWQELAAPKLVVGDIVRGNASNPPKFLLDNGFLQPKKCDVSCHRVIGDRQLNKLNKIRYF